ncbi:MAG: cell division protein FtsA [Bacteroidales bacterium]|nr:cell division protein FtsA [Bacteroidales bacterium]
MEERYVTAIDLGTSKIGLAVAKIDGDNIEVVYHKETPSEGIRYSRVTNPAKAGEAIRAAVEKAKEELNLELDEIVASFPRYEVTLKDGRYVVTGRDENKCVTAEDIREIREEAMASYSRDEATRNENEVLLGAAAQSFNCGEDEVLIPEEDVIGMATEKLEANFKVFVGQAKYVRDMDLAFKRAGEMTVARKYFAPEATAKSVLYSSELEAGVALVDFGAGVTSVTIYSGNIMRHYAAIPFGGRSITMDIKSICAIPERLAENVKMAYGACVPDRLPALGDKTLMLETDKSLPAMQLAVRYLSEIITARETEIVNAVLYEIQESGLVDRVRRVVLTGGGAEMRNISTLFKELSGYSVRVGYPRRLYFTGESDFGLSGSALAGMLLLAKEDGPFVKPADEEDAGGDIAGSGGVAEGGEDRNVFDQSPEQVPEVGKNKGQKPRKPKEEKTLNTGTWFLNLFDEIMNEKA